MEPDSRRSFRDTANDTGSSASFSVRQHPQATPPALTSPAASHLASSPSPSKHCSSDIVG